MYEKQLNTLHFLLLFIDIWMGTEYEHIATENTNNRKTIDTPPTLLLAGGVSVKSGICPPAVLNKNEIEKTIKYTKY
jgi:hypothetical protein